MLKFDAQALSAVLVQGGKVGRRLMQGCANMIFRDFEILSNLDRDGRRFSNGLFREQFCLG
ncbi:MAG TPA: hypothetical protein VED87_06495, partial [Methylocystis sp.]|nr:hypothetical protein [Methylocystis sp.]